MAVDLTDFGCVFAKELETISVGLPWTGGGGTPTPVTIDAGSSTNSTSNCTNKIQLSLVYGGSGNPSLLNLVELPAPDPSAENLIIRGVAVPTLPNEAANRKYVDDQTTALFSVHPQVDAISIGDLSGTPGFNYTGTPAPSTLTFQVGAGVADMLPGVANTSIIVDGETVVQNSRLLLLNTKGVGNVNDSDGIYTIVSIGAAPNFIVQLERAPDAQTFTPPSASQFLAGEYVISCCGATHAGKGYVLSETVPSPLDPQKWVLFSTQSALTFNPPIVERAGKWTIGSDIGGADEGKVLVGDVSNCQWRYGWGDTTKDGTLTGNEIRMINSSSNYTSDSECSFSGGPLFRLNATDTTTFNAVQNQILTISGKNLFSKFLNGTPPHLGGLPDLSITQNDGHITPATSQFTNGDDSYGAGLFFDSKDNFTGSNSNASRFLITPHNQAASDTSSLDLIGFDNAGNAVIIAQIVAP